MPFALAGALTDAAFIVRRHLIEQTWPNAVTVRNKSFMRAALQVEKATKSNLTVAIVDKLGRAHLKLHATGGIKKARGRLAIPTARVSRGAGGVVRSQRPGALKRKVVKGGLIFQAEGRGKNAKLRLIYSLKPTAKIKKDVPFIEDFRAMMADETRRSFPQRLARAMASRR